MIWLLEWRIALASRRLFAFNVVVPLLLAAPVALGGAPAAHAAIVYTLLFTFFGVFGAAIPLARDAHSGLLDRLLLAGCEPRSLFLMRISANATIDLVQLAPVILLIPFAAGRGPLHALILGAAAAAALLAGNAIGAAIAALARSFAETALFSSLVCLFLAHGSGVFRSPAPGSAAAAVEPLFPFAHLHAAVQAAVGIPAPGTASAWLAAASAVPLVALATAAAPFLIERLRVPAPA
jgi:hypothetical protein